MTIGIGKVVYATLTVDATVLAIIGAGLPLFPAGGVPEDQSPPWGEYTVISNQPDKALEGTLLGYDAEVQVTWVTATYEECQSLLTATVSVLGSLKGTIAGINVVSSNVNDASDEPNGPIDLDEYQVYQGDVTAGIYYTG